MDTTTAPEANGSTVRSDKPGFEQGKADTLYPPLTSALLPAPAERATVAAPHW